jgi:nicotinamidase/pyrazinamidase
MAFALKPTDALLVIDMQNDFLPGGSLPVPDGNTILPGINSFASTHNLQPFTDTVQAPYGTQHLWPDHCIQGTPGAELHPALNIPHAELILRKGFRQSIDSYSAFTENDGETSTGLSGYLHDRGITRLFFTGVAYDFCVGFSALAAARLGFEAIVIEDLSRGIAAPSIAQTNIAFAAAAVYRIQASEIR